MPELPEIETLRGGLALILPGRTFSGAVIRTASLRRPFPPALGSLLSGAVVTAVERRAKYLLLRTRPGTLLIHLGMSGVLRFLPSGEGAGRHDHLDLRFDDGSVLRLNDPRRFGTVAWTGDDPCRHPLLAGLGPEPLDPALTGAYLKSRAGNRRQAVKPFIMDQQVVAGLGNIYASEALFRAGIDPRFPAGEMSRQRCERLARSIHAVLSEAIALGASTVDTLFAGEGKPGYFDIQPQVYGRGGAPCRVCGTAIVTLRQGARASYFCPRCQE